MWEGVRDWPAKRGADFRQHFEGRSDRPIEEVLDEMVYFLAFAADYAFWGQLEKSPPIQNAVRDRFMARLRQFAQQHRCSAVPSGQWLSDDGLIWMPGDVEDAGEPFANLKKRFAVYAEALSRRKDRSAGERTANVLAAFTGMTGATFIVYAMPLFLGQWTAVKNILKDYSIKL